MAKSTITFEDVDGIVSMNVQLDGPFDATSHAHRQANLVINYLDSVNAPAPDTIALGSPAEHVPPEEFLVKPVQRAIQLVRVK